MIPILVALSLAAGLLYPMIQSLALKGAAVGLLAAAAASAARSRDGWLLAAVLGFGALGDVLLELSFPAGIGAFACGHVAAIALYLRNRARRGLVLPVLLLAGGAVLPALLLPSGHPMIVPFTAYSLLLTGMAAAAWASGFSRIVPLGALLFVISDGLIAARFGPLADAAWTGPAIWFLYYTGQLLVFLGVRRGLAPA